MPVQRNGNARTRYAGAVIAAAAAFALTGAVAPQEARADEVFVAGFTLGAFGVGGTPANSASIPGMLFSDSGFSGTTAAGVRGFGAAAKPGANVNNLGSLTLSAGIRRTLR